MRSKLAFLNRVGPPIRLGGFIIRHLQSENLQCSLHNKFIAARVGTLASPGSKHQAMAQGQIKKPKAGAAKMYARLTNFDAGVDQRNRTQRKQTGSRVIKPKKSALIKKDQMKKVGRTLQHVTVDLNTDML